MLGEKKQKQPERSGTLPGCSGLWKQQRGYLDSPLCSDKGR